jgi:hypothetical protein
MAREPIDGTIDHVRWKSEAIRLTSGSTFHAFARPAKPPLSVHRWGEPAAVGGGGLWRCRA